MTGVETTLHAEVEGDGVLCFGVITGSHHVHRKKLRDKAVAMCTYGVSMLYYM